MKYEALDVPDFPQSVEEIVKPFINNSLFSVPLLEFDFDFYGLFGGFIRQVLNFLSDQLSPDMYVGNRLFEN